MRNPVEIDTQLFKKGDSILVALSGGADSVCLAHMLASKREELGIKVSAAHFIHGIRPEDSESELALVRRLCENVGIPLYVGHGDTPSYARAHGLGLEEGARELRYGFLFKTMEEQGCDLIATAHNLSDNSETVLFNITRGSGISGLKGIPAINGRVIRPLLGVSRRQIEEYDRQNHLEYAVDKTNFDESYSRNKLRISVLPRLREINPGVDGKLLALGKRAAEIEDYLAAQASALLSDARREPGQAGTELINSAPAALKYYILRQLVREGAGEDNAPDSIQTQALIRLAEKNRPSSKTDLGGEVTAEIVYGVLRISRPHMDDIIEGERLLEPQKPIVWNGWRIEIGGRHGVAFDGSQLEAPFVVRSRRPGDSLPMKIGSRNVKKLLIDKKIPLSDRDRMPLICDNRGVLLLADLAKDARRCYKDKGVLLKIECRRLGVDDSGTPGDTLK